MSEAIDLLTFPTRSKDWTDRTGAFLEDAFVSSIPRDEFVAALDPEQTLRDIVSITDTFGEQTVRQPYWLERNHGAAPAPLSREAAQREFVRIIVSLDSRGYFDRDLWLGCVDDADSGTNRSQVFEELLGIPDLWPLRESLPWSDDVWFSLFEVLHDFVARPRSRSFHSWNSCGWHYGEFASIGGR